MAHGVGRVQYALESAAALVVKLLALGLVALLVVGAVNGPAELELDPVNLLAVTKALVGVALLSGTAALAGGALTGRRIWGVGVGSAIAVGGYVLQAIANNSEDLDWLRAISPFDWAFGEAPLANGMDWAGLAPPLGRVGGADRGRHGGARPTGRPRLIDGFGGEAGRPQPASSSPPVIVETICRAVHRSSRCPGRQPRPGSCPHRVLASHPTAG